MNVNTEITLPKEILRAIENARESTTRNKIGAVLKKGNVVYDGSTDWYRQVVAKRKVGMSICAERAAMFGNRHARRLRSALLAINQSPVQQHEKPAKVAKVA
jgi:cytidine deaminase